MLTIKQRGTIFRMKESVRVYMWQQHLTVHNLRRFQQQQEKTHKLAPGIQHICWHAREPWLHHKFPGREFPQKLAHFFRKACDPRQPILGLRNPAGYRFECNPQFRDRSPWPPVSGPDPRSDVTGKEIKVPLHSNSQRGICINNNDHDASKLNNWDVTLVYRHNTSTYFWEKYFFKHLFILLLLKYTL